MTVMCEVCGEPCPAKRSTRKFCSDICRGRLNDRRRREKRAEYMRNYQRNWCKAQRLSVAAAIAPALRRPKKPRAITIVAANGDVQRVISDRELALALTKRAGIELQTDRSDARHVICESCGLLFVKAQRARKPVCLPCRAVLCGCGAIVSAHGVHNAKKAGRAPRCAVCSKAATKGKPRPKRAIVPEPEVENTPRALRIAAALSDARARVAALAKAKKTEAA